MYQVETTIDVPVQRVCDLIVNAVEGGCSEWIAKFAKGFSNGLELETPWYSDPRFWEEGSRCWASLYEDVEDDGVVREGNRHNFDHNACARGLRLMAEKHPHHWAAFVTENDDAITADVFMQLAVLGEVIYG